MFKLANTALTHGLAAIYNIVVSKSESPYYAPKHGFSHSLNLVFWIDSWNTNKWWRAGLCAGSNISLAAMAEGEPPQCRWIPSDLWAQLSVLVSPWTCWNEGVSLLIIQACSQVDTFSHEFVTRFWLTRRQLAFNGVFYRSGTRVWRKHGIAKKYTIYIKMV